MRNKRGFELAWSTLVLMVLAVIFLVFIILFFTGAFEGFFSNIRVYFASSNVDSVVKNCNILASGGRDYSFCCEKKEVVYYEGSEKRKEKLTCKELFDRNFSGENKIELNCDSLNC